MSKNKIMKYTDKQIADLILVSGISTAESSDLIAGRGIGMAIIKQKIEELDGKLEIESKTGKYCQFTLSILLETELK